MTPFTKTIETTKGVITVRAATRKEIRRLQEAPPEDAPKVIRDILGLDFDLDDLLIPEELMIIEEVKALSFGSTTLEKNLQSGGGQWRIVPVATIAQPSVQTSETAEPAISVSLPSSPKM